MWTKIVPGVVVLLVLCKFRLSFGDDFPSLISTNASIAVILDREYLDKEYEELLEGTKRLFERILRDNFKNGGLIVKYFSWTSINLKRDFTAVLSIASCENTWDVYRNAARENLVIMSLTDTDCPRLPVDNAIMIPRSIPSSGNFEELPQVIMDMKTMKSFSWKAAVLLYDDSFDRDMIARSVAALSKESDGVQPLSLSLFLIESHTHMWEKRKTIRKVLMSLPTQYIGTNFIAIVSTPTMELVMEIAKDLNMVNPKSQWLYVVSETTAASNNISAVHQIISEGDNIAFVYNLRRDAQSCESHMLCYIEALITSLVHGLSQLIREEKAVYGQIADEEWEDIRITKVERKNEILKIMKKDLLDKDRCNECSRWKAEAGETWGNTYQLPTDALTSDTAITHKRNIKLLDVGYWTPQDGFIAKDFLFPHIENGFRGAHFNFYTYHNPPWQFVSYNESGQPFLSHGVILDIISELSKKLNFTFTVIIAQVNSDVFVNLTDDGNNTISKDVHSLTTDIPSDIMTTLFENKILLAAVGTTISEKQKKFINFTKPISIQTYSFIVSRPKELSRVFLFLSPFTFDTWLCLTATVLLMAPVLYIVNRVTPFYEHHGKSNTTGLGKMNNCFWYVYGALLQQGGLYLPNADSGRIIIGTWWLVVLVIVTTYCGNLVAFLTFPKIAIPITTISQLVRNEQGITWSIRKGTFLEQFLRETDDPKYIKLRNGANFIGTENDAIIRSIHEGHHVHIDWRTNLKYLMKREFLKSDRCDFVLSMDEFLDEQIALAMPKASPYIEVINDEITKMHQFGFIERWLGNYLPRQDKCSKVRKNTEVENHTVNNDDMTGSYYVLLIGFSLGIFMFLLEYGWRLFQKYRKDKLQPFTN
ncbi:ionotropic receptor 93a [Toxorhynchites rutilus septentrionalis]|uniref:ionotropic receptor 93a n=1 Tax=Toxorhynchites rutilus septentrionalis TaxID=329112 RepID=UPI00247A027B|nr:ionotropic receptor 93a [Toxorhynchites rutilus septentrionalis]